MKPMTPVTAKSSKVKISEPQRILEIQTLLIRLPDENSRLEAAHIQEARENNR